MTWNSVSESMPPQGEPVLAYYTNEDTGEPLFDVLTFNLDDSLDETGADTTYETWSRVDTIWERQIVVETLYYTVTHWMFLPDPPEDVEE